MTYAAYLECPKCGKNHSHKELRNTCDCGSPLLVRYDLERMKKEVKKEDYLCRQEKSLWRYREFLPVEKEENIVTLGEGFTPIFKAKRLGEKLGLKNLYVKDEGLNPTGTFKARGAALGVSRAKELGVKTVAMPTAGNAGGAWSAYCARAGLKSVIVMPVDAPDLTKKECVMNGADTYLVKGLISDAGKIIAKGVKKHGWFDASTLKEPYRIEGKKTMGLEIAEQFGWQLPDVILYPTGGGVGIIGIWKALQELEAIGWISGKKPRLVSVQVEGCNPIVKAYEEGRDESEFCEGAHTIAGGIRVPKALGDFLVLQAIRETGGTAVQVTDEEIIESMKLLAETEGMLVCPEGATLVKATEKLAERGFIKEEDRVVILNTGCGLKYPDLMEASCPVLEKDASI